VQILKHRLFDTKSYVPYTMLQFETPNQSCLGTIRFQKNRSCRLIYMQYFLSYGKTRSIFTVIENSPKMAFFGIPSQISPHMHDMEQLLPAFQHYTHIGQKHLGHWKNTLKSTNP
jgi:hypothetical protein